jgi:prepilin signal peptidase PulO-like enzyme (type II secretory pathway)
LKGFALIAGVLLLIFGWLIVAVCGIVSLLLLFGIAFRTSHLPDLFPVALLGVLLIWLGRYFKRLGHDVEE